MDGEEDHMLLVEGAGHLDFKNEYSLNETWVARCHAPILLSVPNNQIILRSHPDTPPPSYSAYKRMARLHLFDHIILILSSFTRLLSDN